MSFAPELTPNRRQAHRFLGMLRQYAGQIDHTLFEPDGTTPVDRHDPAFQLVVRPDVEGALPCDVRLDGALDQHLERLAQLQRETRCGVFVEVDAEQCIVAETDVDHRRLRQAWPCAPSVSIHCGRVTGPSTAERMQLVWLLSGKLGKKQREAVVSVLQAVDPDARITASGPVLLRLSGFYSRFAAPQLVSAVASSEAPETNAPRYSAGQLLAELHLAPAA